MTSRTASTALPASLLPRSDRLATWATNSAFVTLGLLLGEVVGERRYQRSRVGPSRQSACQRRFSACPTAQTRFVRRTSPWHGCAVWRADRTPWHQRPPSAPAGAARSSRATPASARGPSAAATAWPERRTTNRSRSRISPASGLAASAAAARRPTSASPARSAPPPSRTRAPPPLRVAGEQRAAAVEDRRAAQVDRERRHPRQRAGRRERRARHRGPRDAGRSPAVGAARDNARVTFIRIAWLATVLACVITGVVLLVSGYQGYAAVFGAVGACAAINLR